MHRQQYQKARDQGNHSLNHSKQDCFKRQAKNAIGIRKPGLLMVHRLLGINKNTLSVRIVLEVVIIIELLYYYNYFI